MSYRIEIAPDAFKYIKRDIPADVLEELRQWLKEELAKSPTKYLRTPPVNFAIKGMLATKSILRWPICHYFKVDVKYSTDEERLLIACFGYNVYRLRGNEDWPCQE